MDDDRFWVKSLTLENFRCFEKTELGPFDPHFNLLVGANGTGKSSVLLALANLFLSLGMPEIQPTGRRLIELDDIRLEYVVSPGGVGTLKLHSPAEFNATGCYGKVELEAHDALNANSLGLPAFPPRVTNSRDGNDFVPGRDVMGRVANGAAPIILFYKTGRLSNQQNDSIPASHFKQGQRQHALENWANAGMASDALREWFKTQTLAELQRAQRLAVDLIPPETPVQQVTLINSAINVALPEIKLVYFDADRDDIVVQFDNGERKEFAKMSDGQRILIGLVADIARRVCVLNAFFLGNETLERTTGLVLIDEIDLHLHPKWQRRIVGALKDIFPKIQFFATTHSPQVIGEARPHEILMLTADGKQKRPMGSYGMESSWVLECVMDAEGRDPVIARRASKLFELIDDGDFEAARTEIEKLREEIGPLAPDVVGAESYLWRIEHEADEAAE